MIDLRTATLPNLPGALCAQVGLDIWWDEEKGDRRQALAVCNNLPCPVRAACLAFALDHHPDGVWGGTTEGARRRMRQERKAAA